MKDYQDKKRVKKQVKYRTSKQFLRRFNREKSKTSMGARPRALGGHR